MKVRKIVCVVLAAALVGGCANLNFSKEDQGTVIGGITGGVVGSMFGSGRGSILGAIIGTFAGGYLGRTIGHHMDEQDRMLHAQAIERAVTRGSNNNWENPHTGHRGRVEGKTYYRTQRGYCREYTEFVQINGRWTAAHGTACQGHDGSWHITN